MLTEAISKAIIAHSGQFRKGTGDKVPYSVHPIRVGMMLKEDDAPDFVVAAGFCHDVHEDTDHRLTTRKFVQETIDIVELLTKKKGESKISAVEKIKDNRWALLVKMADRLDNFSDSSEQQSEYISNAKVQESTKLLLKYASEKELHNTKIYIKLRSYFGVIELAIGRRVINQHGEEGTVIKAGAYGDQPFQIFTKDGEYRSFIENDGTAAYNDNVWKVI